MKLERQGIVSHRERLVGIMGCFRKARGSARVIVLFGDRLRNRDLAVIYIFDLQRTAD